MSSSMSLLATRRFAPLCIAQACGALNDNLVKNAMLLLAMFTLGQGGAGLAALAGALFIAPYALLSATAGQLADRTPKRKAMIWAKAAEVALMTAAAAGFLEGSVPLLLGVVLGLGVQAAFVGPIKFGLLPELLAADKLLAGNGLVEATTFMAILGGTVAGGMMITLRDGPASVAAAGLAVSVIGLLSSLAIPKVAAAAPGSRVGWNLFAETWANLRLVHTLRPVWLSVLGLSWFWTVGATLLTEFPVVTHDTLGADAHVVTLMLSVFALGTAIGSLGCAKLLKGEVSARLVPFAAVGISVFCWDFASAASAAGHLSDVHAVLVSTRGLRMLIDLALLAACGGAFSVPLYAIIQARAPEGGRSRMIAGNNIMNALFMVVGAGVAAGLAAEGIGAPGVLHVAALANVAVAAWIFHLLPQEVFRTLFRLYFNTFHGVEVRGLENYRAAGDKVVIVANHLSFADASLVACFLPDSPTFAVHTQTAAKWWARPFLAAVDIFKVDVQSPYAIKRMVEAVRDDGRKLMIFPEGRLTKTGGLMKVYEGAGVVADKAGAMVLPISIDGLQFTRLGRMKGKLRMRWFPRLSITVMPPVRLAPPASEDMNPRQRRELVGRNLQSLMVETVFAAKDIDRTLFSAFLDARDTHGGKTHIVEDIAREPMSYDKLLLAAVALGRKLEGLSEPGECLGVMLPNASGTVVTLMALQAFGRTAHTMNVSTGADGMTSICGTLGIRTVLSSKAFIEKAKLGKVVEMMEGKVRILWLDEVRASIGFGSKVRAKWDARNARRLRGAVASPNSPAIILATSGSEGKPKGVVLSHRNILANCAQLSSVIDFNASDRVMNAMPMFHSFGLTGGTLLPLFNGVRAFHYPSPLHYRIVPTMIYDTDATICFGTDTFLNGWAKFAHPYDFRSMRYIFAGAERVRDETKRTFADRFGVRVLEGYGATETAPALAMNTAMHCRAGSVGLFLPGIEHRLESVPGIEEGGRLFVKGPNVMLGYMLPSAPGVLVPPEGGWYDTGDIVAIDGEGFVSIRGRAKRFAKIAGEMVSMTAAEALATSLWPQAQHAVVSLPDPRKGEQLLLVTTQAGATPKELLAHARQKGIPELMVPRSVLEVPAMPLLGTGKTDYPSVQRLAAERPAREAEQEAEDETEDDKVPA